MKAIFIVNLREIEHGDGLPKVITLENNNIVKTFLYAENGLNREEILLVKSPTSIEKIKEYQTPDSASEDQIILIRDDAVDHFFNNKTLFKDACVVYHAAADNNEVRGMTEIWKNHNTKSHVIGQHERDIPGNPYNVLNDVFQSLEGRSDFNELIDKVEKQICPNKKLIAVLEFLHQCLDNKIPDGELKPLKDAGIPIDDKDEISKAFEALKEEPDNKNEYLIQLRDALLKKLGIV